MSLRNGDTVRFPPGSKLYELLELWADLTGRVAAVDEDGSMIAVDYPPPFGTRPTKTALRDDWPAADFTGLRLA